MHALLHPRVRHAHSSAAARARAHAARGKGPAKPQTFIEKYGALKPFAIISVSYLLFTITDGAIRTIILLHAFELGFSAM